MTDDIGLAFAYPDQRADALARGSAVAVLDRISLRDYIVSVDIGAFQSERGAPQRIRFNVVVDVQPLTGPVNDDVDRILSYDQLTQAITLALADERLNLLETLADRVASLILAQPQAARVFVRIEKIDRGPGALGVEIMREQGQTDQHADSAAVRPRVVYLSNAAIFAAELSDWITGWTEDGLPLILCVGAADLPAPRTMADTAQRRIDLLAIEQNAWVLAGRHKGLTVVGTLTELEWAVKNDQICVWAPSKIVLDAINGPSATTIDAVELAAWFAQHIGAAELLVKGTDISSAEIPVRGMSRSTI